MIRLTALGPTFTGTSIDLEELRTQFDQRHYIRLNQLLDRSFTDYILRELEHANFETLVHGDIGSELFVRANHALYLLRFLANNYSLFQIIQSITGCSPIGCFAGRIYRVVPGLGHFDRWHDDLRDTRLVAMSINLSPSIYEGGRLQLRKVDSEQIWEIANTGLGDAIIFRIGPEFRHRISEVRGEVPKTAFAGWFQSSPNFMEVFHELRRQRRGRNDISSTST